MAHDAQISKPEGSSTSGFELEGCVPFSMILYVLDVFVGSSWFACTQPALVALQLCQVTFGTSSPKPEVLNPMDPEPFSVKLSP